MIALLLNSIDEIVRSSIVVQSALALRLLFNKKSMSKGVDHSARRKWDREVFAKKAEDRAKRETEDNDEEPSKPEFDATGKSK
jgi:hypothetical protein